MRVHSLAQGQGDPVLFLHGLGGAAFLWEENLRAVAGAGLRAVALDLPGHGLSDDPLPELDVAQGGAFVLGCMDALGMERAVLVGGSAGGLLAVQAALAAPDRVTALALMGAAGLSRRLGLAYRLLSVPFLGEALSRPALALGRAALRGILSDRSLITDAFVERWLARRRAPGGNQTFLRLLRMGVDLGGVKRSLLLGPRLGQVSQPVLLVWGAQDRVVPVEVGQWAQGLFPRAELLVLDGCGHWPHLERRETFNARLLAFLRPWLP